MENYQDNKVVVNRSLKSVSMPLRSNDFVEINDYVTLENSEGAFSTFQDIIQNRNNRGLPKITQENIYSSILSLPGRQQKQKYLKLQSNLISAKKPFHIVSIGGSISCGNCFPRVGEAHDILSWPFYLRDYLRYCEIV